ncbi:MAG: hypothetical protein QME78_13830 [Thermodesulfobacteriota bacterium]|nr:hypothetical protein [Thermodesulfobacteriota bacterium]
MKLHVWNIGRAKFEGMPEAERTFIIGLGHIENEINVLQKLLYWTSPAEKEPDVIRRAHSTQALTVAKILTGKLWEAWQFLQHSYFASRISADYDKVLGVDGKEALEYLKLYFSRDNIVSRIRNNFAFHYSVEQIRQGFSLPPDTDEWQIVLSEARGNSLYYLSDLITNYAMLNSIDPNDHKKAMDRLIKELLHISHCFMTFGDACWIIVGDMYLRKLGEGIPVQELNLEDCSSIDEVKIPFFIEPGS